MIRSALLTAGALMALACGGAQPSEEAIYYDPSLRPGVVQASTDAERQALARMSELAVGEELRIGDRTFVAEAPYHAASGRRCRALRGGGRTRLACEGDEGWVFVPEVLEPAERVE